MEIAPSDVQLAWETAGKRWHSRLKVSLWIAQKGLCHWCGTFCLLPYHPGYLGHKGYPGRLSATLDHLYSRLNPKRTQRGLGVVVRYVMACQRCNQRRNQEEQKPKSTDRIDGI